MKAKHFCGSYFGPNVNYLCAEHDLQCDSCKLKDAENRIEELEEQLKESKIEIHYGVDRSGFGTGVQIDLTGDQVAIAIGAYLEAHEVYIFGPRTIQVNGELIEFGGIYVDPSGYVIHKGKKLSGRGPNKGE